jgi:hypothetical protein
MSPDDLEARAEDTAAYAEYERTEEAIPLSAMETWAKSWGSSDEPPPRNRASRLPDMRENMTAPAAIWLGKLCHHC